MMRSSRFVTPAVLILLGVIGKAPGAFTVSFEGGRITNNSENTGAGFNVTVYGNQDVGYETFANDQVVFLFHVDAGTVGQIAEIYFQDGTLFNLAQVNLNIVGTVQFIRDQDSSTDPGDVPGGQNAPLVPFVKTASFSADTVGSNGNTIGAEEAMGILFDLQLGMTYQDVVDALVQGASQATVTDGVVDMHGGLRIAIHVHNTDDKGRESDGFVNPPPEPPPDVGGDSVVPEPSTIVLALTGVFGLGLTRLRRSRRKPDATV